MPQHDQLHRYLFENFAVRGELVTVSKPCNRSSKIILTRNRSSVLAELLVATSLLTATLKFAGDITVQLQGDGPLSGRHQRQQQSADARRGPHAG